MMNQKTTQMLQQVKVVIQLLNAAVVVQLVLKVLQVPVDLQAKVN
jgi:hypothetical protein